MVSKRASHTTNQWKQNVAANPLGRQGGGQRKGGGICEQNKAIRLNKLGQSCELITIILKTTARNAPSAAAECDLRSGRRGSCANTWRTFMNMKNVTKLSGANKTESFQGKQTRAGRVTWEWKIWCRQNVNLRRQRQQPMHLCAKKRPAHASSSHCPCDREKDSAAPDQIMQCRSKPQAPTKATLILIDAKVLQRSPGAIRRAWQRCEKQQQCTPAQQIRRTCIRRRMML